MASNVKIFAVDHPIKSVTVFKSSKAEVVRTFTLDLKAGQNKIDITGLPSAIDTQSVRVSGLGEARLFDVVCTIGDNKAALQGRDNPSEIIRLLNAEKSSLESEKRVREHEADLLVGYAKTLNGEHITPTQMGSFLESFVDQGRKNLEAINEIGEKIVEIDRRIEKEVTRKQAKKGEAHGEVTIVIVAQDDGNVELKLTYIVANATWEPTYELHASTENGKPSSSVFLHYRARITQSTGESWTNTALTLSTVSSETKSIPTLTPITIQPAQFGPSKGGFPPFQSQQKGGLFGSNSIADAVRAGPFGNQAPIQQQQRQQQSQPQAFGGTSSFNPSQLQPFGSASSYNPSQLQPFGGTSSFGQAQFQPQQQQQTSGLFGQAFSQQAPHVQPAQGAFGSLFGPPPAPGGGASAVPEAGEEADDIAGAFEEIGGPVPFAEPTTVVGESPLAISYSVEGESTIASDGVAHQVAVAVLPFEAKVTHVTIPRIEAIAFLQCEVKNTSEYRLLPGVVTVILDDSYVSKTSVQDVNKGDTFNCTLGADSATRITYSRTSKTVKASVGTFAEVTNTTTYTSTITVHNKHQFAISDIVVRDVIPISPDKRIKVILRKPVGLADAKDGQWVDLKKDGLKVGWGKLVDGKGGEKEGKFEWLWKVEAGAKVSLEAEWEVKAPADMVWSIPLGFSRNV